MLLDLLDQILRVRSSPSLTEGSFEWPTGVIHPLPSHQNAHAVDMIIRYLFLSQKWAVLSCLNLQN